MKKTLFAIALVFIGSFAFAQERAAIAVFPFEDMDKVFAGNEAVFFYRQFTNEFANKRFRVVPRQDVENLINTEAAFQIGDFSAKTKTAEMQRVLNGTQILSGYIGRVGGEIKISISLFTYPELEQLPGGIDREAANVKQLFDKIPSLVQEMQDRIAERGTGTGWNTGGGTAGGSAGGSANTKGAAGVSFAGDTLNAREQQAVISGLREALQMRNINLVIDEKTNASAGYGFTVTVYYEQVISNGLLKAEATAAFSQGGKILYQSAPYYITETDRTMAARRIAERLKGDKAFFDRVNELLK